MFCLKVDVPQEICDIDDELKAIYHSKDSVHMDILEYRKEKFIHEKYSWYG